jgi:DNA modification methylase
MELNTVVVGDCLDVMREIKSGYFDAVITDPPYGDINDKERIHRRAKRKDALDAIARYYGGNG